MQATKIDQINNIYVNTTLIEYIMNIKTIINKSNNYQDLHNQLSELSNQIKGNLFEHFCALVFKFHPYYKTNTKEVYLLKDAPNHILNGLNLPANDIGIDVIVLTNDNKSYAVQVKFRNNRESKINYKELGTFVGTSFGIANNINQAFYFSNTYPINKQIQRSKVIPIYGDFFDNLPENFFTDLKNYFNEQNINKIVISPRTYQQNIINTTKDYFKIENTGYLEMATGTGKSLTSYWIDKEMNNKLTVILVPSLYLLSQFYKSYCYQTSDEKVNCKFILVGSDADVEDENICENVGLILSTDPNYICAEINNNQKTIIISTYQSSDKLLDSLKKFNLNVDLCIFDEAHKTVGNIDKKWNGMITTKEVVITKRLFMTATPKMYDFHKKKELEINKSSEEIKTDSKEEVKLELSINDNSSDVDSDDDVDSCYIDNYDDSDDNNTEDDFTNDDNNDNKNQDNGNEDDFIKIPDNEDLKQKSKDIVVDKENNKEKDVVILSMCNEKIYGKLIYKYSIDQAISDKFLNDYQLTTIFTDNQYIDDYINNKKYARIKEIETVINTRYLAAALMIFEIMNMKECNHLITYHNSVKNSKIFVKILESLKNNYGIGNELLILQLDGGNSMHERNKIIKSFKNAKYGIITSCRALNEGIDIPIVDSVCFCDERKSISDITQCIGRSLRLYEGKKISKILVPVVLENLNDKKRRFKSIIRILKCLKINDNRLVEYFLNIDNHQNNFNLMKEYNFNNSIVLEELGDLEVWRTCIKVVLWDKINKSEDDLQLLLEYCDKYNTTPKKGCVYKNKYIEKFLQCQKKKINSSNDVVYKKLSVNAVLKKNLDAYLETREKNKNKERLSKNDSINLLFEYCTEYGYTPKHNICYKNINIGWFLQTLKKNINSQNDHLYEKLSVNLVVKNNLDEYLKNKEKNKDKERLSKNESINLLFEYCTEYGYTPKNNVRYKNINIGAFLQTLKKNINSQNDHLYEKLSVNLVVKNNLDEYLKNKDENKDKKRLSSNESIKLLFEYCTEYGHTPKNNICYKNINIGTFLHTLKKNINSQNDHLYEKLSVNLIVKNNLDEYLKKKEKNKDKERLSSNESIILLFEYCDKYNNVPRYEEKYKNRNIGKFLQNFKKKINSTNDEAYKKASVNLIIKNNLDEYLKNKEKNKNKEKITFNDVVNLLFEYCNENKYVPSNNIKYKNHYVGKFLHNRKRIINSSNDDLYKKLSINPIVKNSLDEYLKNKDKNKDKKRSTMNESINLLFEYCNTYNKIPKKKDVYKNKNLGMFLQNLKKKINSSNDDLYKKLSTNIMIKNNLDQYLNKKLI